MGVYSLIVIVLIAFLLDESPRFLITKQRYEKAFVVIKKVAKYNGKIKGESLSIELLEQTKSINEKEQLDDTETDIKDQVNDSNVDSTVSENNIREIWSPKSNLLKTIIFMYLWVALNLIYYGISLGITSIDKKVNPYVMYLLSRFDI
jgi:hypothetical protein